jgi:predicted ATPase with chaperone activity
MEAPLAIPQVPQTLEETGLDPDLLVQLIMKTLYFAGEATGVEIAEVLRLPYFVLDPLFQFLRTEKLIEVRGVESLERGSYRYSVTSLGRERAREFLEVSSYVGPAPVPLNHYADRVRRQSVHTIRVDRETLRTALARVVVSEEIVDQLGPAINSGHSIFLYGPSGNGKTLIAEAIGEAIARAGDIFIPHAIEVGNHIIKIFTPVDHVPVEEAPEPYDRRWVRCRRPTIFVGGELTLEMLDLRITPASKYYEAPPQVKANGGIFILDDLGRQLVRPRDLLNRWIVPLEKRVDYFTLHTGEKFPIPFDTLLIFATNIEPRELVDDAFLRRLRFKIHVANPTRAMYEEIFRRECERHGLAYDPAIVEFLYREVYDAYGIEPRGCHPRDLIEHVLSRAKFLNCPAVLSAEAMARACRSYFVFPEETGRRPETRLPFDDGFVL